MSWILNSMEPKIYGIFVYSNTVEEMWKSIYEMYSNSNNSARVFEIQQSIASLKQAQDQSFIEHFGHFKQRLDELRQYRSVANSVQVYIKGEEQDEIHNLLKRFEGIFSYGPSYYFSTQFVLSFHNEETQKRAFLMENGSKVITSSQNSEKFAHFSSQSGDRNKSIKWKDKKGGRLYCDHCNRSGHSKDRCWVLYPYLKSTQNRPKQANMVSHSDSGDVQSKLEQLSKQMKFLIKKCTAGGESSHNSSSGEASNIVQHTSNLIALASSYSKLIVDSEQWITCLPQVNY
jgi:hypothetical protein